MIEELPNNEKNNTPISVKDNPNTATKVSEKTNSHKAKFWRLAILVIFISMVLAAFFFGWFYTKQNLGVVELKQQLGMITAEVQQEKNNVKVLQQSLVSVEQAVQQQEKSLETIQNNLTNLTPMSQQGDEKALLIKVEQLVRQANLSLNWQRDIPGAIALLQTANKDLTNYKNSALLAIQEQLQKTINELNGLSVTDVEDVVLQLMALDPLIAKLSLRTPAEMLNVNNTQNAAQPASAAELPKWRQVLNISLAELQKIIIIRHHDEPIEPLMTPEQGLYLKQNLQAMLQQAQWAALHQKQKLYQQSVSQIIEWIKKYFDQNTVVAKQLIEQLENLSKKVIAPTLPDLTNLIEVIKKVEQQPVMKLNQRPAKKAITGTKE